MTKVVKACIVKLNKEWEKVSEQKQKEAQLQKEVQQQWEAQQKDSQHQQDSEAMNNQAQDSQKRNNSIASSHESGSNYQRLDGFNNTSQSRVAGTSQGEQQGNNHQSQSGSEYSHGDSQVCLCICFWFKRDMVTQGPLQACFNFRVPESQVDLQSLPKQLENNFILLGSRLINHTKYIAGNFTSPLFPPPCPLPPEQCWSENIITRHEEKQFNCFGVR